MFAVIIDMMELNKNNLRTIEAQIVQKLKNNEARPKFTGSYKKKAYIVEDWNSLPLDTRNCTTIAHLVF